MNAQKLTEKSLEAIQRANDLAISHQNQMIQQIHLLCALLQQESGLIPQLFQKMGLSAEAAVQDLERQTNYRQLRAVAEEQIRFMLHRMWIRF